MSEEHRADPKLSLAVNASRVVWLCTRLCGALDLPTDPAVQPLRKAMHMMLLSGYHMGDIEITFAMTLFTVREKSSRTVQNMGVLEKVLVTLLHAYCAHCIVFDECIPCKVWHEWVFASYCSPQMLSTALRKVCLLTKWRFNVPLEDLEPVLEELRFGSSGLGCEEASEHKKGDGLAADTASECDDAVEYGAVEEVATSAEGEALGC